MKASRTSPPGCSPSRRYSSSGRSGKSRFVRLDAVDFEDAAQHALGAFGGESVAVLAPAVGAAREVQPYEAGLLQGHVGNDEPAVARRAERRGRLSGTLAGPGRELAQPDGRGGEQRSRAVGVDHHLLALAADRDGLHAAAGKEPQRLVRVEERGVLHAQPLRRPADERSEREDVGRARLQPHLPAAFRRTAVGVGVDPVEAQPLLREVLLGRRADDLDVSGAEPCEVLRGDAGERGVALERHHAAEAAAQEERVRAQSAGEVQHAVAHDAFVRRARLARRLLEGPRRQDALRRGVRGEFPFGPREVFDLRGDQTGVGHAAVRRHLQRVASAGPGDRFAHLVGAEQGVFFGGYHVGKCTLFFGSALHAARVASAKRR